MEIDITKIWESPISGQDPRIREFLFIGGRSKLKNLTALQARVEKLKKGCFAGHTSISRGLLEELKERKKAEK